MAIKSLSEACDLLSDLPEVDWCFSQQTESFEGARVRDFRVFVRLKDGRFCERSGKKIGDVIAAVFAELKIPLPDRLV